MSLETGFGGLAQAFGEVRDAFVGLGLTAVEDQPELGSVALVDWFADFVQDLNGAVQVGVSAVERGGRAARAPRDLGSALRSLMECQRIRDLLRDRLSSEPSVQSRLEELRGLGLDRGGEWLAWIDEAFGALQQCRGSLDGLVDPLLLCWQDLAEELAAPLISVQTTSIGQQFTLPHEEGARR